MRVECNPSALNPDTVRVLCSHIFETMKVPTAALEKLIFVDADEFGAAVHSVQALVASTEGYTDNSYYTAVGKTIPRKLSDGTVASTIVCRQELIQAVLIEVASKKSVAEWSLIPQQGWYVIHHEFGHALDYYQRRDAPINSSERFSSLRQIGDHYTDILLSEFAASFHSGHAMSTGVYADEVRSTNETLAMMAGEIEEKKRQVASGSASLFRLAATVSQTMWLALVQYAKVFGSRAASDPLGSQPVVYWMGATPATIAVLEHFAEVMESIRKIYPNWTAEIIEQLFDCWEDLCDANGYAYEFRPSGDEEFYFD